ncbi:MAG TPA: hypothetical protein VI488_16890 [Candidatus Angelobacter sp.]
MKFTGGTPTAAAVQIGSAAFTAASIQSGNVTLSLPMGTTQYAIAYVCPPVPGFGNTVTSEFIIEATTQDGTTFTVSCQGSPSTGSATGSANASLIAGSANVFVRGNQGFGGSVGSNNGSFSVSMPTGTNDVALAAVDGAVQPNVLAVRIVRSQTVPGAINGGSPVIFASTDATTTQSLTVNNIPAGFVTPPAVGVFYNTTNGTSILLDNNSATSYPAVPTAAAQSGDFYTFESNTSDTATHNSAVGITQTTTSGGGAMTIALPASWSFAGPAAAALPTFTFNYTGFSGMAAVAQQGEIEWAPTLTTLSTITVTATANFQNGATTITIPNLASLSGFLAPAPSGTNIFWVADVFGGTAQEFAFFATPPANGSLSFVQNRGNYTEP